MSVHFFEDHSKKYRKEVLVRKLADWDVFQYEIEFDIEQILLEND